MAHPSLPPRSEPMGEMHLVLNGVLMKLDLFYFQIKHTMPGRDVILGDDIAKASPPYYVVKALAAWTPRPIDDLPQEFYE